MKYHFLLFIVLIYGCCSQPENNNSTVVKKDSIKAPVKVHDTACKYDVKVDYKVINNSYHDTNKKQITIYFLEYADSVTIYVNRRVKEKMKVVADARRDLLVGYDVGNADTIKNIGIQIKDGRIAEIEINKDRRFIGVPFLNKILSVEFYNGRQMAD